MNISDIVSMLDKKFSGAGSVPCPNEGKEVKQAGRTFKDHGNLTVHGSASIIICGRCGYNEPVARP